MFAVMPRFLRKRRLRLRGTRRVCDPTDVGLGWLHKFAQCRLLTCVYLFVCVAQNLTKGRDCAAVV